MRLPAITCTCIDSNPKVAEIIPKGANREGKPLDVSFDDCNDRHPEKCAAWAENGECEKNPGVLKHRRCRHHDDVGMFIRLTGECMNRVDDCELSVQLQQLPLTRPSRSL